MDSMDFTIDDIINAIDENHALFFQILDLVFEVRRAFQEKQQNLQILVRGNVDLTVSLG